MCIPELIINVHRKVHVGIIWQEHYVQLLMQKSLKNILSYLIHFNTSKTIKYVLHYCIFFFEIPKVVLESKFKWIIPLLNQIVTKNISLYIAFSYPMTGNVFIK